MNKLIVPSCLTHWTHFPTTHSQRPCVQLKEGGCVDVTDNILQDILPVTRSVSHVDQKGKKTCFCGSCLLKWTYTTLLSFRNRTPSPYFPLRRLDYSEPCFPTTKLCHQVLRHATERLRQWVSTLSYYSYRWHYRSIGLGVERRRTEHTPPTGPATGLSVKMFRCGVHPPPFSNSPP